MRNGKRMHSDEVGAEDAPAAPVCDHADCDQPGLYPAPKSRDQLREYFWFCLEHVRAYNKAWNYFGGVDADGIERQIRRDTVWERPTWPLGRWGFPGRDKLDAALRRAFGFDLGGGPRPDPNASQSRKPSTAETEALRVLELVPPVTWAEVKARYKGLAKRLHPDANGGDKAAEEQLKLINRAYSALKSAMVP
jgi:hypothetical protein